MIKVSIAAAVAITTSNANAVAFQARTTRKITSSASRRTEKDFHPNPNPNPNRHHIISCCMADSIDDTDLSAQSSFSSRRNVLVQLATMPLKGAATAATATTAVAVEELVEHQPGYAAASTNKVHITANWKSVDGLNSLDEAKFVSFENSAYAAMRDDKQRTPYFEKAIINRLNDPTLAPEGPESQVVLDLGTGPYALFAILAAKNGAKKVYAVEASPVAAAMARETVKKLGYDDVITVLEDFSTNVVLPDGEKVDFVVAEIVGSVASEEGAYATIVDAHERLVKV